LADGEKSIKTHTSSNGALRVLPFVLGVQTYRTLQR
jgi:hypothetical protein